MTQHINIDDFKGVITNADLSDLPNNASTVLENFKPTNGKLVKTYDVNDISEDACPLLVTGWDVSNIYTYINENLANGFVYVAILQNQTTFKSAIVWWVNALAPSTDNPVSLVPFGAGSFIMVVTDYNQEFRSAGYALILNTIFTSQSGSYNFTSESWAIPNLITGTDGAIISGGVPTDLGFGYQEQQVIWTPSYPLVTISGVSADIANAFASHVQFDARVKDFYLAPVGGVDLSSDVKYSIRADGNMYVAVEQKSGGGVDDLYIYDAGWSTADWADLGYNVATSYVWITGFKTWNDILYITVTERDTVPAADEYNHSLWKVDTGTFAHSTELYVINQVSGVDNILKHGIDDVTMAIATYDVAAIPTEFLFVQHGQDVASATTTLPSVLKRIDASDAVTNISLGAVGVAADFRSRHIFTNEIDSKLHVVFYNNPDLPLVRSLDSLTPSWGTDVLPATITGMINPNWNDIIYSLSYLDIDGTAVRVHVARIVSDGTEAVYVVSYDDVSAEWSLSGGSAIGTSSDTPTGAFHFQHADRQSPSIIVGMIVSGVGNSLYRMDEISAVEYLEIDSNEITGSEYKAFSSHEIEHGHLTSTHLIYGNGDDTNFHPTLRRMVCLGARPEYIPYAGKMLFNYSATACVGWQMAVNGDLDELWQQNIQNPITMDKGVLRLYAGAVSSVTDNESASHEAKNTWIGYIDREFLFGEWAPDAGFYVTSELMDDSPDLTIESAIDFDSGYNATGFYAYKITAVYDGNQESLLPDMSSRVSLDAADRTVKLTISSSTDVSRRLTAIKLYRSFSAADTPEVYTHVKTINFSSDANNQDYKAIESTASALLIFFATDMSGTSAIDWTKSNVVRMSDGSVMAFSEQVITDSIVLDSTSVSGSLWDESWEIKYDDGAGLVDYSPAINGSSGYHGEGVLFNDNWDWGSHELDGWVLMGTTDEIIIKNSYQKVILSENITFAADLAYDLLSLTNGYTFALTDDAISMVVYDSGLTDGASHPLDGAVSLKVNSDIATIIGNRTWQGRVILDVGGENEEQLSAITYSELNQLDVTPVSNLIKLHDREGGGITGITEMFNRPVITMKQNVSLIDTSNTDPALWGISESPHNIGNIAKHGMVAALGSVYVVYYDGIYGLTSNNLAETDTTPTDRLKITDAIEDIYRNVSDKTAITGEYNQSENEILWTLGDEVWAYSTDSSEWREISSSSSFDILTIDENADVIVFDSTDGALKSFNPLKVTSLPLTASTLRTKRYAFNLERKSLLRKLSVYYDSAADFTVNIYMDDSQGAEATSYAVAKRADVNIRHIPIKRYCTNFQIEIVTESSIDTFELNKLVIEVEE